MALTAAGTDFSVLRYNADGSLDTTVGIGGTASVVVGPSAQVLSLVVQPDAMLVAAGSVSTTDLTAVLVRFDQNGVLDTAFGTLGIASGPTQTFASDLLLDPNGKLVAAGGAGSCVTPFDCIFGVVRWNADGTVDSSFGSGGVASVFPTGGYYPVEGTNGRQRSGARAERGPDRGRFGRHRFARNL